MLEGLFNGERWKALFSSDVLETFVDGFYMTLWIAVFGILLALTIGIIFGLMSTSKLKILRIIARVYVEFFQNTPLVVQVFFYWAGLPKLLKILFQTKRVVRIPKTTLGIMSVGLYHGAYVAEVIRTGLEAVPKGQYEAAYSQGFTRMQAMRYIVLPQTLKIILPPLTNQALNLVKNTSVLALIAGMDLMYQADVFVSKTGYLQGYLLCAVMYFIICFPLSVAARKFEQRQKNPPKVKKSKQNLLQKEVD